MADIRLMRPGAGEVQNITCAPEARFIFDFPTDEATLSRSGDNLVITFEDGATLQLENFYTAYSSKNMPSFEVEGAEISGEDFFTAMNEPDLMPAAGPGGNAGAQSNGNRFHSYVNSELLGGLDRLGGLDIGWNDGGQDSELDGGGGGHVDFGVTLTGESGEVPDPSIPVIDDPTYPDQPGWDQTVTGRDVLNVKESELDGAGSRSVDHGSLLVDARDGVASIVIDGVTVYEGTEPPVLHADARVNTDEGYLTNFRYSAATGRLEYDYVLTQATTEHKGEGKDSIAHNFHVTVTDTDGDTGTGLITVVIEDDVPLAADDAAGLEENESVSGNVVTGEVDTTGTEEGFVSVGKDDYGADAPATTNGLVWNLDSWGEKASYDAATETWTVVTDYGTATLYADGSFKFEALKNAGLDEGVSASMNFDYTITDADGDSSSATLTVTVTGDTQPVVTFDKPGADSNAITVDEALIPGKGNAEHSDSAAHAASGEGSFTVNFKGESGDVTLTYGKDESAQTVTLRLEQGRQTVAPSEGGNTLIVNGVTVTVTGAVYDAASREWTVNYTYNLETGQEHGNDELIGDDDVLSGTIDITVKDDTDDTATGSLQVTVHDDGPMVTLVPTEYEDKNYFNTVSVSFGADNETGVDSSLAVKAYEVDADGQNPRLITWTKGDGSTSCGFDLSSLSQGEWTSADGNIIVSRENGNFVFKIKENGTNADITVTATDADGDTDSKTLHLTAPDSDSNEIIVDEALLSDGSIVNSDKSAHAASGTGSFTVDLHGEDGTVTLTYDTGENTGENTEKNLPTVTLSLINNDDFDLDSWLSSKNMQDPMRPNTFVVNGVTVTVTGATQQQDDGPWQIEYTYELKGEQAHTDKNAVGAADDLSGTIGITVTDATGDTATGELTVTVHDDGPVLNVLTESSSSDALNENTGPFVVNLNGLHIGADMVNGTTPAKVTVAVGGQTYAFTVSKITVTDGYYYEFSPVQVEPDGSYTPVFDSPVSITGNATNGYKLTYTRPATDKDDTTVKNYTFTVTVTDADGDSVSENITLTTKDRPDISFGTDKGRVEEAGVAGHFPADGENANSTVPGNDTASGTITLTDTDSAALTLTVTGNVQHTDNSETHDNTGDAQVSSTSFGGNGFSLGTGGTLTLYLNADGELVTAAGLAENEDYYGTLTLDFSDGKTGSWNFTLNEGSDLVDSLKEGESFDITLNLTANDGTQNDRGYTSDEATLTIHIQGTNDMPVFTTATANGKEFTVTTEHQVFGSVGDIVVTDEQQAPTDLATTIEGKLTATDPDDDNGAGSDVVADNHLIFTVTGLTGTDVGNVDATGSYASYVSGSNYNNLVSRQEGEVTSDSDDKGSFTQVTTTYGTLKVYADGSYTYTPTDTSKIGGDEYVIETFTVKVQDAHGSWDTQTITITLRDEDNVITGGAEISQSLREEGVVGDDPSLGYTPGDDPNEHVTTQNGMAAPNNVLFTDADVNDSITLNFSNAVITLPGKSTSTAITGVGTVTVGAFGSTSASTTLYLVATKAGNTWDFSWSEANNGDVVGELVLSRGEHGEVTYSFALDPANGIQTSTDHDDNSGFLDQLDQGDVVNIELPITARPENDIDGSVVTSTVDITITGTNDRPLIDSVVKVENDGTETTETELDTDDRGRSEVELDKTEIYDASSSDTSGDDSSSGDTSGHAPDFTGRVVAHDVDSDNGAGSTEASGTEDNNLSFTLTGMTSTGNASSIIGSTPVSEGSTDYVTIKTTYGTLTIDQATGKFTYTMDDPALEGGKPNAIMELGNGQSVTETYTVRVTDAHGSYSTTTITFTITGTNDRPILTSDALEVHAAENNTPDITYHEDGVAHSTDQAEASDPDKEDSVTFCFATDKDAQTTAQSVDITAEQLLEAIKDTDNGAVFTSNGKNGDPDTLALLKAWLSANPTETVATLNITADGELSLTLNQYSDFIEALNGEDSFTFDLSDISNLQVYAKDKGGLLSAESNDVKLVIHGTNDAYVVISAQNPHVKESGVYREEGEIVGNTATTSQKGTDYGGEKEAAEGSFTLAGRDAGQVVFTVDGKSYEETSTTLTKGESEFKVEFTTDTTSGDTAPSFMYVAGEYGYYKIDLDSNMDADGTRTFTYEYHLYTESTPDEVKNLCIGADGNNDFADRLNAVNALPQGANVSDSVTIGVAVGEDTTDGVTLSAQVSGTNDKPVINGVEEVTTDTGKVALEETDTLDALHDSKDSGMFFEPPSGEDGTGGPVLHIQVAEQNGYDFVGRIKGEDLDKATEAAGGEDDGTHVVNYSFVLTDGSSQVWTISKTDAGESMATSNYGYITIDNDGKFTLHLDEEAVKFLSENKEFDLFQGLAVQCTDDLGATSQSVELHGTLLGKDDDATTTVVNPGMWENAQSAHDESRAPENPFPGSNGAGLVEHDSTQLKGYVTVHDPDTSDTIVQKVTIKVADATYIVSFDDSGDVVSVADGDGDILIDEDGKNVTTVQGDHGEFTFTFQDGDNNNEATLHYEYTVIDDEALNKINALNDGETYSVKYGSEKNPLPLENIKVSFISQPENGVERPAGPAATITIDVHGSNDAPEFTTVTIGDDKQTVTDDTSINGGEVGYQGSAEGVLDVIDPDDDKAVRPSEGGTTGGATGEGDGTDASGTGSTGGRLLQIGFLVYHDEEGNEVLVYGKTGTDGITEYYRMDGGEPLTDVTLAKLTFSQQADLEYGTIYVNDYGEYIYHRNPNASWPEGTKKESVFVTVMDQHGAMDSVEIDFTLTPATGPGRLPDVSIEGVTMPGVTEPGENGELVVAGEESGVVSSFDKNEEGQGGVEDITLTVKCYKDDNGQYIPVYKDGNTWKTQGGKVVTDADFTPTPIYGRLEETADGEYQWKYYTDKKFTTSVNADDMVSPSLDFRLSEIAEPAEHQTVYSLSTDYGTVYVDKETGELRFELDSRADALNAGEVKEETVYLWVNGKTEEITLTITGTGDPSEVTSTDVTADLSQDVDHDDKVTSSAGTITIDDIDNSDTVGIPASNEAFDTHTLTINNVQGNGAGGSVTVNGTSDNPTIIYVMKGLTADGKPGYVFTTTEPGDTTRDDYYGELAVWRTNNDKYDYNFTAWADTKAGKEIKPGDRLEFDFGVTVTDTSSKDSIQTTSDGSFTVTVVGKADAVEFEDDQAHINEEGMPGHVDDNGAFVPDGDAASGALSVSGNLGVKDFDQSGYTVTASFNDSDYSSVVKGEYGTLILNNDGTYSYVLDYGKCQGLGEKDIVNDVFTVKVHNAAGDVEHYLTVNVHGVNDLPVVTVTPALSVQEGLPSVEGKPNSDGTATGKVDAQDVDESDTLSFVIQGGDDKGNAVSVNTENGEATVYVVGERDEETGELTLSLSKTEPSDGSLVGTLTMDASGNYTFTVADSAMAQSLNGGKSESITVNIGANDGHETVTKPVTITIHGTNEAPEVKTELQTSESTVMDTTPQDGSYSVTFTPAAPATGEDGDGYTVTDADWGDELTYTFEQGGRYFTSSDAVISINDKEYPVSLSIDPDGTITMTYDEAVKDAIDALGKGETATLNTEKSPINLVVQDGFGGKTSSPLTLSVSGENDDVVIHADQPTANIEIVDNVSPLPEGSFTFTDVDVNDTHTVALPKTVQVTLPGEETAEATVENGVVKLGEIELGTIKINSVQDPADGKPGQVFYTFNPSREYLTSLGEGETTQLDLMFTVSDANGLEDTTSVSVTLTGSNDVVSIDDDQSNLIQNDNGTYTGSLVFSDKDVSDTHTVTFEGLYASEKGREGDALSVNPADLSEDSSVPVYDAEGVKIGTMKFDFVEGNNNQGNKLSYTFTPADDLNSLTVGENNVKFTVLVSDGEVTDSHSESLTLTNANDAVVIADGQLEGVTIDSADKSAGGSFTFTDADVKDTHTVSSSVQVKLPDSEEAVSAQVDGNGVVKLENGTVLGTLEVTRNNDSTGGETGQVSYTFKPSSDYLTSLGKGESTQLDLTFSVSDGHTSKETTPVSVTLTGSNDAVSISSGESSLTPNDDGTYTGSLVFSDKDVSDTHTVTFDKLFVGGDGDEHKPLSVNTADLSENSSVSVYDEDGVLIGSMQFEFTKGDNNQNNKLSYTFTPVDPNSLPVGDHNVVFTVSVADESGTTDQVDEPYTITITNENDEVNISSGESSLTPNEDGAYTGSLVFSDADVTDTHTVTFEGLYGNGGEGESLKPLSVNTANLSDVDVYNANGDPIGKMQFTFTKGENDTNTLSYTFNPEKLTENLSVEVSVSDGHKTETAPTVNVTFNKPEKVEVSDVTEGSGDGSEAEEEQARVEQENGLLTAAMVVSGLNGVLDASFDEPLFDAQTDAPDVPEGQDVFAVDSLVLPDAPDAPAFAVADASAEHAAPQMFSLHADPAIPEATMHESAADAPEASPADDASSDAPDLISLLADNDPGTPEHGFLFGAPEGDVFSGSDGNDYMVGGEGSDAVMAGDGNDIVVYDGNDYLIDGGSGIDFIVSNDDSLSLNKLLTESGRDGHTGPIVNGVEVLIKGDDALSLTSMDQLSKDYGVTIGHDAQGNETLTLNADQWHANADGSFDYVGQPNVDLTLETSLTPVTHDDAADAAVQQQVFILQNTQG